MSGTERAATPPRGPQRQENRCSRIAFIPSSRPTRARISGVDRTRCGRVPLRNQTAVDLDEHSHSVPPGRRERRLLERRRQHPNERRALENPERDGLPLLRASAERVEPLLQAREDLAELADHLRLQGLGDPLRDHAELLDHGADLLVDRAEATAQDPRSAVLAFLGELELAKLALHGRQVRCRLLLQLHARGDVWQLRLELGDALLPGGDPCSQLPDRAVALGLLGADPCSALERAVELAL